MSWQPHGVKPRVSRGPLFWNAPPTGSSATAAAPADSGVPDGTTTAPGGMGGGVGPPGGGINGVTGNPGKFKVCGVWSSSLVFDGNKVTEVSVFFFLSFLCLFPLRRFDITFYSGVSYFSELL